MNGMKGEMGFEIEARKIGELNRVKGAFEQLQERSNECGKGHSPKENTWKARALAEGQGRE